MHELVEEAAVAASVDAVWADFTDATYLVEWFWPPRLGATATLDPHQGGSWRVRSEVAGIGVDATVLESERPHTLRLAWRWDGEDHSTDAEIMLEPTADATRVKVRHSGFQSEDERDTHIEGWSHCLQRLVDRHGGAPGQHLRPDTA